MENNIENLVLEHLKRIQQDIANLKTASQGLTAASFKTEQTLLEIKRDLLNGEERDLKLLQAISALQEKIDRIERRLDLVDEKH